MWTMLNVDKQSGSYNYENFVIYGSIIVMYCIPYDPTQSRKSDLHVSLSTFSHPYIRDRGPVPIKRVNKAHSIIIVIPLPLYLQ